MNSLRDSSLNGVSTFTISDALSTYKYHIFFDLVLVAHSCPKGLCEKIVGGSLQAKADSDAKKKE